MSLIVAKSRADLALRLSVIGLELRGSEVLGGGSPFPCTSVLL